MIFKVATRRVTLPENWHQVTLGQLLAIRAGEMSTLQVIAVLSGQPLAFWQAVNPADIADSILPALEWSNQPFNWGGLALPNWLTVPGQYRNLWFSKVLEVPMNLDLETYGQKVYIESLIGGDLTDAERVPMVLAAYFEPIYSGQDFNTERLADFLPIILSTSCTEALPIYSFFFRKFRGSMLITAG